MDEESRRDIDLIQSYVEDEIGSKMTTNYIAIKRGISVLICLLLYGIGLGFAPLSGSGRYSFPIVFTVPIVLTAVLLLPGKKKNPAEIPD